MNETTATVSEYHIGHTTYRVTTTFNPAFRESLSDILKRLITRDCENLLGDNEQEQDKQAV
ncbi:MAG: transposon-encoded TnpW family protein [Ruminococcus sp.]|nr:transposon-encoded TnpW family protein [Ruminococcus sp.]